MIKTLEKDGKIIAEISIKKMTREENKDGAVMFQNLFWYLGQKDFVDIEKDYVYYIDSIYVEPEYRRKGYGSVILSRALGSIKKEEPKFSKVLVVAKSCLMTREFPEEPDNLTYNRILSRNGLFYEKNKFISVNDIIGNYGSSEVFMFNGPACKKFIACLESFKRRKQK